MRCLAGNGSLWGAAFALAVGAPAGAQGGAESPAVVQAARAESAIRIDGVLDEADWARAEPLARFTQRDPLEGAPASDSTEVRILYDADAVYVGARLRDRGPVTSRLGRRDMAPDASDWLRVSLDTQRDRRTAYRFEVNPAGVRRDAHVTGDAENRSWDPVWEAATRVGEEGWWVEMRIPLSVLRFGAGEQVWGLQVERIVHRLQEHSMYAFTPRSEAGGVAAFADLVGLRDLGSSRGLELLPYAVARAELVDPGANPYRDGSEQYVTAGLDATLRLTSNLTLVGTVNPDFGQVEVDPAVINLTAFETFFEEKRPFFVEGSGSFEFGGGPPGPWSAPRLFYSRRIGRAPQLRPSTPAADVPASTTILGAAKLTGRTANGWSLGVLDALTEAEYSLYRDGGGADARALAEPLANSLVVRVQRELDDGRGSFGAMGTALNRALDSEASRTWLRSGAYTAGVDFRRESADRGWAVSGMVAGSRIGGSPTAIEAAQRSPVRYFHRPDAEHLDVDPAATSLAGYSGSLRVQKRAGEHILADLAASVVSPGFEVNDLGFQSRADRMGFNGTLVYRENRPGDVLRRWSVSGMANLGRNFGGDWIDKWTNASVTMQHLSYWTLIIAAGYEPERASDRLTRGGPLARNPAAWNSGGLLQSDPRKPLSGSLRLRREQDAAGLWENQVGVSFGVRPSPRWSLSAGPSFTDLYNPAQYVTKAGDPTAAATHGARYFFAPLRYSELALETRLNVSFTPDLTLELFAQPLLSTGAFAAPVEFTRPGDYAFHELAGASRHETPAGPVYRYDPDGAGGPAAEITIPDRDFTAHSLRGNAVLRWEWRAGSTLFLVWQQGRSLDEPRSAGLEPAGVRSLLATEPDDVLALKVTYWLSPRF